MDDGSASWDGVVVQAALDARCRILLTEDLAAGVRFGELEVVNPFEPSVHEPAVARRKRR